MVDPPIHFTMATLLHYPKTNTFPPFLPLPLPLLLYFLFSIFPISILSKTSIGPQQKLNVVQYATGDFFTPLSCSPSFDISPVGRPEILAGFPGINAYESSIASVGSPFEGLPDMALAVGSGYVLQAINSAIRVFSSKTGKPVTDVTDINQFFNLTLFNEDVGVYGDYITNPRAFYDPLTKRFFVFICGYPTSTYTRFPKDSSFQLVAVSRNSNPSKGFFLYKYNADLMDSGDLHKKLGPCPCVPFYQMVGFDYYGVQITSQSKSKENGEFVGIQFQVISKGDLVSGKKSPIAVRFDGSPENGGFIVDSDSYAYAVQPAVVPFGYLPDMKNGGTQYFLSSHYTRNSENGVELWALTNTQSLRFSNPELRITRKRMFTEVYSTVIPPTIQGDNGFKPVPKLDAGDTSMQQVVYGNGTLMGAFTVGVLINTTVKAYKAAITYVAMSPFISKKNGRVNGRRIGEGRFSFPGSWAFYPSLMFNKKKAMVVFALAGPSFFPSIGVFFIRRSPYRTKRYVVVFEGVEPSKDYTNDDGDKVFGWGTYFGSCLDEEGNFWVSGGTTLGGMTTRYATWGTYIAKISGN